MSLNLAQHHTDPTSMSMEEFNELQERQRLREGARAQIVRARENMERQAVRDRLERVRSMREAQKRIKISRERTNFIREAQKRSKSLGFATHGTYI